MKKRFEKKFYLHIIIILHFIFWSFFSESIAFCGIFYLPNFVNLQRIPEVVTFIFKFSLCLFQKKSYSCTKQSRQTVHYPQIDKFIPTILLCSKTIYFKCEVSRASKKGQITNCSTLKKSFWQQQPFLGMNFNNVRQGNYL